VTLRLLPCGDAAVMLDLDSLDEVLRLQPVLDATRPRGVVDIVPGARSILAARSWTLAARPAEEAGARGGAPVEIDVVYDGEDLADVAALLGIDPREVVERHTSGVWTVAFGGFAPGFGYLAGVPGLEVPRRTSPRPRVPAGAVALAGEFSGIYPRVSPGGWQLIGTTRAVLWDPEREPAALLQPGSAVRFREVDA
jgi:KipI family sensor histidine kinase inhibitor